MPRRVHHQSLQRVQLPPRATHPTAATLARDRSQVSVQRLQHFLGNQGLQHHLQCAQLSPTSFVGEPSRAGLGRSAPRSAPLPVYPGLTGYLQPKLAVSEPGDTYEQEADKIADHVMGTAEPQLRRSCDCGGTCPDCQTQSPVSPRRQTNTLSIANSYPAGAPPIVLDVLQSPGHPLDATTRTFMESGFGRDFSSVSVHTDDNAAASAHAIQGRAYTVGSDMVFASGQYAPATLAGRRLIAHELAHVVQQEATPFSHAVQRQLDNSMDQVDDMDMEMERKYANSGAPKAQKCGRPARCPPGFCDPYSSQELAEYYRAKKRGWLLFGIARAVNSRVLPFWETYLDGGADPRDISADFGKDFTNSPTTAKVTGKLVSALKSRLTSNTPSIARNSTKSIDLATLIPGPLAAVGNPFSVDRMNFSGIRDIPGNIAGDIATDQTKCLSGAKPSPLDDARKAIGTVKLTRGTGTDILASPEISYFVQDTVDLCPGDCGAFLEQFATVPLSQFEATGISGDVPFTVTFPAPSPIPFFISGKSPASAPPPGKASPSAPVPKKP